jgi:hypothetical protein
VEQVVIGFIPPIVGVEAEFNTFRLGKKFGTLPIGSEVLLMDEKRKVVFGKAVVTDVTVGPLSALCAVYAPENHTELQHQDGKHAECLYQTLTKIYGPHIVKPDKTATVIKLRRTE